MSRRTGINEAPEVELGIGGEQQTLPVLRVFPDRTSAPGKTTIARMLEYFSGGAIPSPQMQRFRMSPNTERSTTLNPFSDEPIRPAISIPFSKDDESLIIGDEDYYTDEAGNIHISRPGGYRAKIQLIANITSPDSQYQLEPITVAGAAEVESRPIQVAGIIASESFEMTGRLPARQLSVNGTVPGQTTTARQHIEEQEIIIGGDLGEITSSGTAQGNIGEIFVSGTVQTGGGEACFGISGDEACGTIPEEESEFEASGDGGEIEVDVEVTGSGGEFEGSGIIPGYNITAEAIVLPRDVLSLGNIPEQNVQLDGDTPARNISASGNAPAQTADVTGQTENTTIRTSIPAVTPRILITGTITQQDTFTDQVAMPEITGQPLRFGEAEFVFVAQADDFFGVSLQPYITARPLADSGDITILLRGGLPGLYSSVIIERIT